MKVDTQMTAEQVLDFFIAQDEAKFLMQKTILTHRHNGLEYVMVRKEIAIEAMVDYATGCVWMKATEKLPDNRKHIFFEWTDKDGDVYKHAGEYKEIEGSKFFMGDTAGFSESEFKNIRWLS